MLLKALEIEPAMEPMAQPTAPRLRVEPRQRHSDVLTLVVDAWIGKRQFCEARVVERRADSLTVMAAAPLEEGEQIWFTENDSAGGMFVSSATPEGDGFRLELERERRRSPRWRVDEHGEVEWRDGDKVQRVNVVVVDVSAGGLRFRTTEDVPESGEVRVKFAGMVRDGEIRYAVPLGGATIAGIEFA
jgi:hypothetical protein